MLIFKALVVQALYNLSDQQPEYQLRDRLSLMRFLGLGVHDAGPDATTLWLYREALARAGAVEKLFAAFDGCLREHGLFAMGGQIIDATIVAAPRQRNSRDENAQIKRGETLFMRGGGFLTDEERQVLRGLARDGLAEHRLARRANALVLVDRGMSYRQVAKVLLLDNETIRQWRSSFEQDGIDGLVGFHYGGRQAFLTPEQEEQLRAWVSRTLPHSTRAVRAYVNAQFGVTYDSRSGLVTLLHRLGFEHRKPRAVSGKMGPDKQRRFIALYEKLLNSLSADEMVMFTDAVHSTYGAQPVGCWAPKVAAVAVEKTTGREQINIQAAIDLETGTTCVQEVESVDAASTIALFAAIEARFLNYRVIYVIADKARCHHAWLVQAWLARPGCRIRLLFIPPYCPHLNPIERLWGLMRKSLMHNQCAPNVRAFRSRLITFLRYDVPANWASFCDQVTDNFRVRDPGEYRILK